MIRFFTLQNSLQRSSIIQTLSSASAYISQRTQNIATMATGSDVISNYGKSSVTHSNTQSVLRKADLIL